MTELENIVEKNEPSAAWLPFGSAAALAAIVTLVLVITVFPLSLNWTIGLSIALVIAILVIVSLTISGWSDWRLFSETSVEAMGTVIRRVHQQTKDEYDHITHVYVLVVEFIWGGQPLKLKERVDKERYAATNEGRSLVVRFAQNKPELAIFDWTENAASGS